ncbi:hypothetical protein VTH06DRAFT_7497 [Thermothelomyces fergusii]
MDIKTRFLILSDTHAGEGIAVPDVAVDVAIHCGDLTEESKLSEFRTSLELLKSIKAPLKLVIAGNHDFTLDTPVFQKKVDHALSAFSISPDLLWQEYGRFGEARQLFAEAASSNIMLLDEGTHHFKLQNGARLTVYASPYTPSLAAGWGFQYRRGDGHNFALDGADVVITHGPPRGVLDLTASRQRGGCDQLFAAVARSRPRLHCFGHIHEGWGSKLVTWRGDRASESPSHFSDIDNAASTVIESLATLSPTKWDSPQEALEKEDRLVALRKQGYRATSHYYDSEDPLQAPPLMPGRQTLFVNAAVQSLDEGDGPQLPWVVDIGLPPATG